MVSGLVCLGVRVFRLWPRFKLSCDMKSDESLVMRRCKTSDSPAFNRITTKKFLVVGKLSNLNLHPGNNASASRVRTGWCALA